MENKDDEVEKILNELKFAGGNEPQPKNDENDDSASFKLNEKEMLSPQKAKTEKTAEPENPQPKENGGEKESGVEAIEKDLIKARENDNEVQKPSLPFAPEEINPQNGNYTDEYPEAEGYMKNSKNKKIIIAVVAVIVVVAIAVVIYFGVSRNKKEP